MKQSLTIIGYGWVSQHFINHYHQNFHPIITTSKSSTPNSFSTKHHNIDIYNQSDDINLPLTSYCLITIPFSRQLSNPIQYSDNLITLLSTLDIDRYSTVIFTSSTSIYPKNDSTVDENTHIAKTKRALALSKCEQFILNRKNATYILRLSGICGYNRQSQSQRSREVVQNSNLPVNLIHMDDISAVIYQLFSNKSSKKDIINLSCSKHPTKEEYYRYLSSLFNTPCPQFKSSPSCNYKTVSNEKLIQDYGVSLKYPSPLMFKF